MKLESVNQSEIRKKKIYIIYEHIYMKSKKMVLINITGQD